jgi:GTP-binding protein
MLDGSAPITAQDQTVAGYAAQAHRPLVLVVNKWDLVPEPELATKRLRGEIGRRFRFARYAPVLTISARTGLRVDRLLPLIEVVDRAARKQIATPELNRFLRDETSSGRGPSLHYMTQTGTRPPAFTVFTHDASRVHFSHRRRLENRLRECFDVGPTPIILRFRSRSRRRVRA